MKKIILLAIAGAAVGAAAFIACNQNPDCKLKRKIHSTRRSFDRSVKKASGRVEKEIKKALDKWEDAKNTINEQTENLNAAVEKATQKSQKIQESKG